MAQVANTKKVGGVAAAKHAGGAVAAAANAAAATNTPKKAKRGPFDVKTALMFDKDGTTKIPVPLNEEGELTACPINWDRKQFKPLKKSQFADEASAMEFSAVKLDQQAALIKIKADQYREDAKNARLLGDPTQRKALSKVEKMAKQFLELQASLQGDGATGLPSLQDILAKVQAKFEADKTATAAATPAAK